MATKQGGMVFMEPQHPIIRSLVYDGLNNYINEPDNSGKRALDLVNVRVADFDGVLYHVEVNQQNRNTMSVSMQMNGFRDVAQAGGDQLLRSTYGSYMTNAKANYDLTLNIDASRVAATDVDAIADNFALLKRNFLAAPLQAAFEGLMRGNAGSGAPTVLQVRPTEQLVIAPANDRVNVVQSFAMIERDDMTFCEMILDAIARNSIHATCPNIRFSKNVPNEISGARNIIMNSNTIGFLLFSVSKNHVQDNMAAVVDLLLSVRHYVHYHIKALKAMLHTRMRAKVQYFLQVLNRARPERQVKKKKFRVINF